jgi:hypothetical protein
MGDLGAVSYGRQVRIEDYPQRVWILRGHDKLHQDSTRVDIVEALKGVDYTKGAREILDDEIEKAAAKAEKAKQPFPRDHPLYD